MIIAFHISFNCDREIIPKMMFDTENTLIHPHIWEAPIVAVGHHPDVGRGLHIVTETGIQFRWFGHVDRQREETRRERISIEDHREIIAAYAGGQNDRSQCLRNLSVAWKLIGTCICSTVKFWNFLVILEACTKSDHMNIAEQTRSLCS